MRLAGLVAAGAEEAAAISAAISRFQADTAPVAVRPEPEAESPWLRAALNEGVMSAQSFGPPDPNRL